MATTFILTENDIEHRFGFNRNGGMWYGMYKTGTDELVRDKKLYRSQEEAGLDMKILSEKLGKRFTTQSV